jgi:MFS family permease
MDIILQKTGIMKTEPFDENPVWLIAIIVAYRTIFNTLGCYLTARLAPRKPMKHAIILGIIVFVLTIVGMIVMWHLPPHWYPISLAVLTLPAAWLGGKMAIKKQFNMNVEKQIKNYIDSQSEPKRADA